MSFNNTLGIKYDAKFVRLVNRLLYEHAQVRSSDQAMSNLKNSNLLSRNLSDILSNKNKEMKEQSETTLKHIFKYIDRRVERAVLEERKVQEVDKLKKLYEKFDKNKSDELMSFKASGKGVECPSESLSFSNTHTHHIFAVPLSDNRAEMMRVTSDGMCYIHEDNLSNVDILEHVERAVVDELIKINPSSVLITGFRIKVEAYRPSWLEISLEFYYNDEHYGFSTLVTVKKFDIRKLVKEFSDKINKIAIARDKYIGI